MTNKEQTISNLKKLKSFHNGSYGADIDRAIKALEQEPCEDCISRREAIKMFTYNYTGERIPEYDCDNWPVQIAIKTVKEMLRGLSSVNPQEPFKPMVEIDLDYVIKQKYIERDALDKIRAEIKSLSNANPSYWHSGDMVDRDDVLDIIDKYKESEE